MTIIIPTQMNAGLIDSSRKLSLCKNHRSSLFVYCSACICTRSALYIVSKYDGSSKGALLPEVSLTDRQGHSSSLEQGSTPCIESIVVAQPSPT